jgi:hypothetical protein
MGRAAESAAFVEVINQASEIVMTFKVVRHRQALAGPLKAAMSAFGTKRTSATCAECDGRYS